MKLRIRKIKLKNFKTFKYLEINANSDFNIIIGENSSGKSSIFEAIHLWEKCYETYILSSRKGFYKVKKATNRYVNYQDLDFLRITKDEDVFHDPKDPDLGKCAEITITLANDDESATWSLGFKITCPTSIENAFYRVQPISEDQFTNFASNFCNAGSFLDEAIFIYQTRPVSGVHQYEPYYNEAQIKKKIQKGSSHEVLRNKIISKRKSISELEKSVSEIVGKNIKFHLPSVSRRDKDEFIDLKVSIDGLKPYDLHLQGSGLLQIIEILATIEFIDAPLKLLLVDEPDSHIHAKIQRNLLNHLKCIDHNQFFVISHNDQFVTSAKEGEVFFLRDEAKKTGVLSAINSESFDIIKNTMGGVIMSLERLNSAEQIVFVEGKDDAGYLQALSDRLLSLSISSEGLSNVTFFPLRGKDNILQKVEYNRRTLSSILKNKTWNVIYDRDFSTKETEEEVEAGIQRKKCIPFSHEGYCIESVVFSDRQIMNRFFCWLIPDLDKEKVLSDVNSAIIYWKERVSNINDDLLKEFEFSFNSQKKNRPELLNVKFNEVVRHWLNNDDFKIERIMSKAQILKFVEDLEARVGVSLFLRTSNNPEEVSSRLLLNYFDFISCIDDIAPSFQRLLTQLNVLQVEELEPLNIATVK